MVVTPAAIMDTATAGAGESASVPRGGATKDKGGGPVQGPGPGPGQGPFLLFGSRLNSMKDRPDLWPHPLEDAWDWVRRQLSVSGLGCVDFNYPQHFASWTPEEARAALDDSTLRAGSVCLRYPPKCARGAMNQPYRSLREEAIELTKGAAEAAGVLRCNEVVVWSAYDGYDYPL